MMKNQNKYIQPTLGKVDAEKYLDICLTQVLEIPNLMIEHNFDINQIYRAKKLLTLQLENVAIATGKIKMKRVKINEEEYTENQKEIRMSLINYFKKENPDIGIGAVPKAKSVMKFIMEGEYATKIDLIKLQLKESLNSSDKNTKAAAESQLDNFKFQAILTAALSSKPKRVDIDA